MENYSFLIFILILAAVPLILYLIKIPKQRRRRQLYKSDFPQEWIDILTTGFALYSFLPIELRRQLHGHINIFLYEKNFVGYQGIEINDTIRVVIAAQACVLLLNRKTNYYPHLTNILIYPNVFNHQTDNGEPQPHGRLGESWHRGPIVLSWIHSKQGGANTKDGQNVVMHEFAHQLDQENGPSDGLPILQHNNIKQWSTVLGKEFKTLKVKLKLRRKSLLDKYGATNPAEFFAVITEHFIEQPKMFLKKHPELYGELKKYYQVDPIGWY
jgi:Mlc titration factor MtfA (ptsG expression regulator)